MSTTVQPHLRLFVGQDRQLDIARALVEGDAAPIFGALSGG